MGLMWAIYLAIVAEVVPTPASLSLYNTRPSSELVRAATAECKLGNIETERGVVGISDPHTVDPEVIDLIAETGVKWARAEFHWSRIQRRPGGPYDWAPYDRMVRLFNERGIKVQAILTYIPENQLGDWAQIDQAYQSFARAAVARYAPMGVHYWEVFNEPNLPGYGWLTKREKAADYLGAYTLLLARTNKIVREVDPKGVVLLGGLASDQHRGLNAERTMQEIYSLGARECFDVMVYHPYGYQNRFHEARARVDEILRRAGDTGKRVWFNEYGWTEQAEMDLNRNANRHNNPMIAAFAQRDAADAFFWFAAKDYSAKWRTPEFGLATFDLEKRPSFYTFQKIIDSIQ